MKGPIPFEVFTREGKNEFGGPASCRPSRSKGQGVQGSGEAKAGAKASPRSVKRGGASEKA